MKLYHRYSRFAFHRLNSKADIRRIRWALTLKPGDLINDCSGFNRVVAAIEPCYIENYSFEHANRRGGWAISGVDFTTEPHRGSCSLLHCGVEPAIPRATLEADWLRNHTENFAQHMAWAEMWYSGKETEGYKQMVAGMNRCIERLQSGGHILDERGIVLPEFDPIG